MKIYLLDRRRPITECWAELFAGEKDVEVVCKDFHDFMNTTEVQCVVSPANSYGLMDGGYDLAITDWFGTGLMKKVQERLMRDFYGEQPVGTSILVETDVKGIKLIHTPTMRVPSVIRDPMVVYHCMRSTLMLALENNIESIVIPAFGGACGSVPADVVADMMYKAYSQIMNPPWQISWNYAERWRTDYETY